MSVGFVVLCLLLFGIVAVNCVQKRGDGKVGKRAGGRGPKKEEEHVKRKRIMQYISSKYIEGPGFLHPTVKVNTYVKLTNNDETR